MNGPLAAPAAVVGPGVKASCASCSLQQLCLPMGLDAQDMARLDAVIGRRRRVARGVHLYRTGAPFGNLYAIRFGSFKTCHAGADGSEQISGFQMAGELLGMDAIGAEFYQCDAVALEDSEVCEIPFAALENLFAQIPTLLRHFHRTLGQEITREQNLMLLLGNMRAEQRFAVFLVNLSARYAARGYSATEFQLRMSREEIGNFLGLTIESISRLFARFRQGGLVAVEKRGVTLLDPARLRALAAGTELCSPLR